MQIQAKKSAAVVFPVFIFLFFLLLIDPRLIHHVQDPPFLRDMHFFSSFAGYPGGMVWYISAFLTQWHIFPWLGALIITLFISLNYLQAVFMLRRIGMGRGGEAAAVLPALLLFAAYCDYRLPLSYVAGVSVALLFSNLYLLRSCGHAYGRLLLFGILATVAYCLAGTGALLFAAVCGLYELLYRKKYATGVVIIAAASLLPLIGAKSVFVISVPAAYYDVIGLKTNLLAAAPYPRMPPLIYGVYLFFPLLLVAGRLFFLRGPTRGPEPPLPARGSPAGRGGLFGIRPGGSWLVVGVYAAALACTAWRCFDGKAKANYRIDYHARHCRWDDIVREVTPVNLVDYSVLSQMHLFRALYYRNRLLSDLFMYPGALPGKSFLMITGPMAAQYPVQMSDCFFEIGGLNQSEYWAHEALSLKGKKTRILQRLALINLLKGRKNSAEKFITLLGKTLFGREAALNCSRFLDDDSLFAGDDHLRRIGSYMPHREYSCRDYYAELVHLFEENSDNRIAFEFIVAENLLNNSIGPIVENTGFFRRFGYERLPRHVEEAVVVQLALSGSAVATSGGFRLDNGCFRRFEDFNRILSRYREERPRALKLLAPEYGRTYWYYLASTERPVLLKGNE
ncbi:MAG: hypothetical protein JXA18_17415 [Chitinispirillaceae bacterium]|nr:hypothetical protein [Chitinispirillaceae bacterium]